MKAWNASGPDIRIGDYASRLERVGVSADRARRGTGRPGDGQHLDELACLLIGHLERNHRARRPSPVWGRSLNPLPEPVLAEIQDVVAFSARSPDVTAAPWR